MEERSGGAHDVGTFTGTGGIELHWQRWLPPEDPRAVIVLVHGFGEHGGRYANVVQALVPRGYAVYSFDHRGHGRSPGPRGHIASWSEFRGDVAAFLAMVRRQTNLPVFLYGHSLGGLIVLEYALHHPAGLAGVVATGPILTQPAVSPALQMAARLVSRFAPRIAMDSRLDTSALSRDPEVVRLYREDPLVHGRATARLSTEISAAVARTQANAAQWQVPLLLAHGGSDRIVLAAGTRAFFDRVTFADKQLLEYPEGFHEPHNDLEHDRVLLDITGWLEAHRPSEGGG